MIGEITKTNTTLNEALESTFLRLPNFEFSFKIGGFQKLFAINQNASITLQYRPSDRWFIVHVWDKDFCFDGNVDEQCRPHGTSCIYYTHSPLGQQRFPHICIMGDFVHGIFVKGAITYAAKSSSSYQEVELRGVFPENGRHVARNFTTGEIATTSFIAETLAAIFIYNKL